MKSGFRAKIEPQRRERKIETNLKVGGNRKSQRQPQISFLASSDVTANIIPFLTPNDAIEFLCCHRALLSSESSWLIMVDLCRVRSFLSKSHTARSLVTHTLRKLQYNCTECWSPLAGKLGLFACSSMCSVCSTLKFKTDRSMYVDGTIRFYLTGEDFITTRGYAFLRHPYWISTDDPTEEIVTMHGSAFHLAEKIYNEKMFFRTHAPVHAVPRPRDDKAYAIRKMIELMGHSSNSGSSTTESTRRKTEKTRATSLNTSSSDSDVESHRFEHDASNQWDNEEGGNEEGDEEEDDAAQEALEDDPLDDSDDFLPMNDTDDCESRMDLDLDMEAAGSDRVGDSDGGDMISDEDYESSDKARRKANFIHGGNQKKKEKNEKVTMGSHRRGLDGAKERTVGDDNDIDSDEVGSSWIDALPDTLLPLYEEQKLRMEQGLDSPPPLGTVPLRDLVRSLHNRHGAVLRSLA